MRRYITLLFTAILFFVFKLEAQNNNHQLPGNGNPLIPGYFADPTIKKFGDTWYLYATTDGNNDGRGPAEVWTSKDFVNWTMHEMNWPITKGGFYWAPDVTIGPDGKYRLLYNIPCESYIGIGDSPLGPWKNSLGEDKPLIPNNIVPNVITLDAQTFKDDDGKYYVLFGTWGIYPKSGCGIGLFNPDMKSFAKLDKIPNTQAVDFFEGPFLFKRNGIYYFTYSSGSCHDGSYKVQYAISRTSPFGPYEFGKINPILETSVDGSIHGPGHHSIIQNGDDYYIIYHRHDNPHSTRGMHRQVCADKLVFGPEGTIEKVIPTHTGIGFLAKNTNPFPNLAYGKKVTASSFYNNNFKPEFAADDNNGTFWMPADNVHDQWLKVDLGKEQNIKRVFSEFWFPSYYYQYLIEYSKDGKLWKTYSDRRNNTKAGCPMVDYGNVSARWLRITITNSELIGSSLGLWNFKVFGDTNNNPPQEVINHKTNNFSSERLDTQTRHSKGLLVDMDVQNVNPGVAISKWENKGVLGGNFKIESANANVDLIDGKQALVFTGREMYKSSFSTPLSLSGNSSFTVAYWVYNPEIADGENIIGWANNSGPEATAAIFGYGNNPDRGVALHAGWADLGFKGKTPQAGIWHHIAITFDGYMEKIYVDGSLNNQQQRQLFIRPADTMIIGADSYGKTAFTGALASLKIYDVSLSEKEISNLYSETYESPIPVYLNTGKLSFGSLNEWKNSGSTHGVFYSNSVAPEVEDINGKLAVTFKGKGSFSFDVQEQFTHKRFTIEGDFLNTALVKNETFISLKYATNTYFNINYGVDGITCNCKTSHGFAKVVPVKGKWHHFMLVVKGSKANLYIDGNLDLSFSNLFANGIQSIILGADELNKTFFKGSLSFFRIYNSSFGENEISAHYKEWSENAKSNMGKSVEFSIQPRLITPSVVYMKAKTYLGMQYNFVEMSDGKIVKSTGWSYQSDFLQNDLKEDTFHEYSFKTKDLFGNMLSVEKPFKVQAGKKLFNVVADDFSVNHDFMKEGTAKTVWDGFVANKNDKASNVIACENGNLKLQSTDSRWDGSLPQGPFLYKNVSGDFVAEVELPDISGLNERRPAGNNDCGLMVRLSDSARTGVCEKLLQLSIFPAWNVGNMFTNFNCAERTQDGNASGWLYERFLQIQRSGNTFHIRTSPDGIQWKNMKGSPVERQDLNGLPLQVGVFQATYGEASAWGKFANFRIFQHR